MHRPRTVNAMTVDVEDWFQVQAYAGVIPRGAWHGMERRVEANTDRVLELLHLRQESVSIAGGIILFLIGIRMIFPVPEGIFGDAPGGEPFIVPLAIPGIAGPSTMAALLLLGHNEPARTLEWSLALVIAWAATGAILFSATMLYRVLGPRVITASERLMGMLLVAISVQMFLDGVAGYLKGAGTGN